MNVLGALLTALALWFSAAAEERATKQGAPCSAKQSCTGGLECVPRGDGTGTCERLCKASAKCPEDQRCVKNGEQYICRPSTDRLPL